MLTLIRAAGMQRLASRYSTVWMPEYGREYWETHQCDRRLSINQLIEIAEGHIEREDRMILDANQILFVDTDATTTFMFSMYYHEEVDDRLAALAESTRHRYDLFFLCETDIPYDDTWDRSGEANRHVFQQQIKADLLERRLPFITLRGTLRERMKVVSGVLRGFDRFRSVSDNLISLS